MKTNTLLALKSEILNCIDVTRLQELKLNLRIFASKLSTQIELEDYHSEEYIKDAKNSKSIAEAYISVLDWKLKQIQLDKTNEMVNSFVEHKSFLYEIFNTNFENYLINHSASKSLKEKNAELKEENFKLLEKIRQNTADFYLKDDFELKKQQFLLLEKQKELDRHKQELSNLKKEIQKIYNQFSNLIDD
ncbi:MAG: hypothetical protein JST62_05985 [Bacteroidetes bacterium]|nr:hypothetical protein [Bacteroidota bacterium]